MVKPSKATVETNQRLISPDARGQTLFERLAEVTRDARGRVTVANDEPAAGRRWTFRALESVLAAAYGIADTKRTTFASRLKNFHRLRFPIGFKPEQGKTAQYLPGEVAMMALALEMTNLGLTPERVVRVLTINWFPTSMALGMAADILWQKPEGFDESQGRVRDNPLSLFIYFDPSALSPLTVDEDLRGGLVGDEAAQSFFYGGQETITESLLRWTTARASRLSLINVTSMLDRIVGLPDEPLKKSAYSEHLDYRKEFFAGVIEWAGALQNRFEPSGTLGHAKTFFLETFLSYFMPPPPWSDEELEEALGRAHRETGVDKESLRAASEALKADYEETENVRSKA